MITMKPIKNILIADRNPRILAYLKRELDTEGYCVHTVENTKQLRHWIHSDYACDIFIVDPDLFSGGDPHDLLSICRLMRPLPIILHGLPADYPANWNELKPVQFVNKSGTSVENLKKIIKDLSNPANRHSCASP